MKDVLSDDEELDNDEPIMEGSDDEFSDLEVDKDEDTGHSLSPHSSPDPPTSPGHSSPDTPTSPSSPTSLSSVPGSQQTPSPQQTPGKILIIIVWQTYMTTYLSYFS